MNDGIDFQLMLDQVDELAAVQMAVNNYNDSNNSELVGYGRYSLDCAGNTEHYFTVSAGKDELLDFQDTYTIDGDISSSGNDRYKLTFDVDSFSGEGQLSYANDVKDFLSEVEKMDFASQINAYGFTMNNRIKAHLTVDFKYEPQITQTQAKEFARFTKKRSKFVTSELDHFSVAFFQRK